MARATPSERQQSEEDQLKILEIMKDAKTEHGKRYVEKFPESRRTLVERAKRGFQAVSETTYEYSQIMGVMAGQAPKYVALAYEAIKIPISGPDQLRRAQVDGRSIHEKD